jgi:hypothetical protein
VCEISSLKETQLIRFITPQPFSLIFIIYLKTEAEPAFETQKFYSLFFIFNSDDGRSP